MRTPAQLLNARTMRSAELEAEIDKAIDSAAMFNRTEVTVAVSRYSRDVIDIVLAAYRRVGWKAEFVADRRDGDFVKLEAP